MEHAELNPFNKIKRKLTFEEDFAMPAPERRLIFPYENPASRQTEFNPLLRLLDSAESVPAVSGINAQDCPIEPPYLYNSTSLSVSMGRAKRKPLLSAQKSRQRTPESSAMGQLETVLSQMFRVINTEVEPFITDKQTQVSLKSYEALTANLLKSLKINAQRDEIQSDDTQ